MFKVHEINKGINLHYLNDKRFKTITTAIFIRNPLSKENATKTALCAECLRGGCKKYPSMRQLSVKLEQMWGTAYEVAVIKRGDEQAVYVYLEGLNKTFYESMDFVKDIFFGHNMGNERFVNSSKGRLKQSIEIIKDRKGEYAIERMVEKLSKDCDSSFGVPALGYSKAVNSLTGEQVKSHWEDLLDKNPIDIFIVGSENENQIINKLKEIFSKERTQIINTGSKTFESAGNQGISAVENQNINQARLAMAFSFGAIKAEKDVIPLLVFSEILGGGSSSRLFNIVREKESLCYNISSFVFKQKMLLAVQAGIEADSFEKVSKMVEEQIRDMGNEITVSELEEGKKTLIKSYEGYEDIPADRINFAFSMWVLGLEMDICEFIDAIKAVKIEEVTELGKKAKCEIKYLLK